MTSKSGKKAPGQARVSLARLRSVRPEELVTFRVALLSHLFGQIVESSVSGPLNLTSRQWRMLMLLNRSGPSTSGQLAEGSPFDPSQISRVSYELVDKGLISMQPDAQDRRRQILALTPAGIDLLRRGLVQSTQRQRRLRESLSPKDYAAFERALDTLMIEARRMIGESRLGD